VSQTAAPEIGAGIAPQAHRFGGVHGVGVDAESNELSRRKNRDDILITDYIFITVPYLDLPKADADYERTRRVLFNLGPPHVFDAVVIGRKASGEVRFQRDRGEAALVERATDPSWSLAAGLALTLFPSIAGDIPASSMVGHETLGAIAGAVAIAVGRAELHRIGLSLDSAAAGLIAVVVASGEDSVRSGLINAQSLMCCRVGIDVDEIERATRRIAARRRRLNS